MSQLIKNDHVNVTAGQQLVETKKGFPQLGMRQNQTPAGMRGMGEGGVGVS